MTEFSVEFLGCKISSTDAEQVRDALAAAGHTESERALVRVVNTCCITREAEAKSRKQVRRHLAAGEDVRVFVTGCGANLNPKQFADEDGRVTVLPGAAALATSAIVAAADELDGLACKGPAPGKVMRERTRAFVKIQDGCDFHCSYCIVPTVRGEPRSRPTAKILDEVARRVGRGQREIVLTGVNIGLFSDPDAKRTLPELLHDVADVDGVHRVRISSIESNHVSRRLARAMAEHPKVCPHLHVPLQSGDDGILAAMRRHYDARRYLRSIEWARDHIHGLTVTTDVILGFPGEDEAAFANTMRVCGEAGIVKVHAFPFSARPGTDAADTHVAQPVDPAQVRDRSRRLRAAAEERSQAWWASCVGTSDEVVVERRAAVGHGMGASLTAAHVAASEAPATSGGERLVGYTRDYAPVRLEVPSGAAAPDEGDLVQVHVVAADAAGLVARLSD